MFLIRNKKNNLYPCKPQFYYIKVGFKGSTLYRHVFLMDAKFLYMDNEEYDQNVWMQADLSFCLACMLAGLFFHIASQIFSLKK